MTTDVERLYLYLPGVVGVFRKCRRCGEYKRLANFNASGGGRQCWNCRRPGPHTGTGSPNRSIVVTDLGHAEVAAMRRAEKTA